MLQVAAEVPLHSAIIIALVLPVYIAIRRVFSSRASRNLMLAVLALLARLANDLVVHRWFLCPWFLQSSSP